MKFTSDELVLKKAAMVLAGIFIICIIGLFVYIVKYSGYIEVNAKIVDVRLIYDSQSHDNQNRNKYIQYKYIFNGKEYTADRLVFFASKNSIGKDVTVKVNPENPHEIANYTFIRSFLFIDILSVMLVILIMQRLRG